MKTTEERDAEGRITDRKDQDQATDPQSNEIAGNVFEGLGKAFDPKPGEEDENPGAKP